MHPDFKRADEITTKVIGAAMEVHSIMGSGLLESIYEKCLMREMGLRGLNAIGQKAVNIEYKGVFFEETLRFDMLVEGCLLVEGKAVEKILPVHKAQLLSYMRLLDIPVGLIFNFHEMRLRDGMCRLVLPGANL